MAATGGMTEPPDPLGQPPGTAAMGAFVVVWGAWAAMLLGALTFVWVYGRNVPFWDEWNMVSVLAGDQAVDAAWLWSSHNGHRIPLPRLLLLSLYRLTGCDFRAGMYFNVLAVGALAFALIRTAQWQRGRLSYADAFFPIILLHWGHHGNFLWTWQVTQVVPILLGSVLLLLIVRAREHWPLGSSLLAGACLASLPLCGVPGLAYVPALSLWFLWLAVRQGRSSDPAVRARGVVLGGSASAALLLTALYFVDYRGVRQYTSGMDLRECLRTALQFLTGAFGSAGEAVWPYSGFGMVVLLLLTAVALLQMTQRPPLPHRAHLFGMLAYAAALGCLALSVGLGRPGYGFTARYYLLAAPALCWAYFVWGSCPAAAARLAQAGLLIVTGLALAPNMQEARESGAAHRDKLAAFERDLVAGDPTPKLLARHASALCPGPSGREAFHDWLDYCFRALHRAGIGVFRSLNIEDPVYREVSLPAARGRKEKAVLAGKGGDVFKGPPLVWLLPTPVNVCGIRVTYRETGGSPADLTVYWKGDGRGRFSQDQSYVHSLQGERDKGRLRHTPGPGERAVTVWVYGPVDGIGIDPGSAPGLDIRKVVLLLPGGSGQGSAAGRQGGDFRTPAQPGRLNDPCCRLGRRPKQARGLPAPTFALALYACHPRPVYGVSIPPTA